jgi:pimeloyl-ACP methyl ester carboxylesterase
MLWPERVQAVASMGSALGGAVSYAALREAAAEALAGDQYDKDENPLPRDLSYAREVFGVEDADIAREQNTSRAQAGRWIGPLSRGVARFDYLSHLPEVTANVLLAWGERGNYGRFVPPALAQLSRAREQVIPNSGAFPHEEAAEATAEAVLSFLS